jgi:NAD(P)-dependent dehydrogenase (short-subunit alcohol dehydrogenase family)
VHGKIAVISDANRGIGPAVCAELAALGAQTIAFLATLPDGGPSGGCFRDRESIEW